MVVVAAAELIFDDDDAAISVFGDEIDADIPCRALFARVGEFQVHHAAKLVDVLVEHLEKSLTSDGRLLEA